jgi:hypothetical protein
MKHWRTQMDLCCPENTENEKMQHTTEDDGREDKEEGRLH